jgi:tetratricopeptide (TPR) repeat protein
MTSLLSRLDGLSAPDWLRRRPSWRALAIAGGAVLVLAVAIAGGWLWFAAEQRRGLEAFAQAMVKVQSSQVPNAGPEAKGQAIRDLEGTLSEKPSASVSSQVTYELGTLKYEIQQYPASRTAYELATRGTSPTLRRLSQVSLGYTWELQKDYPKAIEAFEKALAPLKPGDFLYDDLLMDVGRVQELAGRKDDAIKTYQRVVSNPRSVRSDDARARLAGLGVQP